MKRFSEQLKKKSDMIRLQAAEKRDLHERLQAYMEYHPLPSSLAVTSQHTKPSPQTEAFYILRIPRWVYQSMTGVAVLFLVVTPIAAERALPGDMLYPVKIKINEEVRSSLATSPYEKIEWETERLERRITEAQLLAQAGLLTPEIEASVVDAVEEHRVLAAANIAELRTIDEAQASLADITLASVLDVQSAKLRSQASASSTNGRSTESLSLALEVSRQEADSRSDTTTVPYEWLMAQVEIETTRTYALLNSIRTSASAEQVQELERRLKDIERKIEGAVLAHTTGTETASSDDVAIATMTEETSEDTSVAMMRATNTEVIATEDAKVSAQLARTQLRGVLRDIKKLVAYMSDIDLRSSVTIDALVPLVLTDEEWRTLLVTQATTLNNQQIDLEATVEGVIDEALVEKVAEALRLATELQAEAKQSIDEGNWLSAQASQIEAAAYLDSVTSLLREVEVLDTLSEDDEVVPDGAETDTSTSSSATSTDTTTDADTDTTERATST